MALVVSSNSITSSLLSSSFSSSSSVTAIPSISRLQIKSGDPRPRSFNGVRLQTPRLAGNASSVMVKANSDAGGAEASPQSKEEAAVPVPVPVEKLPLESKLQERAEQKARMKLAKKIRLRRKRLVRKRRLRKKGRWPPSKMKKLKNV